MKMMDYLFSMPKKCIYCSLHTDTHTRTQNDKKWTREMMKSVRRHTSGDISRPNRDENDK